MSSPPRHSSPSESPASPERGFRLRGVTLQPHVLLIVDASSKALHFPRLACGVFASGGTTSPRWCCWLRFPSSKPRSCPCGVLETRMVVAGLKPADGLTTRAKAPRSLTDQWLEPGSEDACHEASQHPRQADAQADNGDVLLDVFHLTVLQPTTPAFCAPDHTASLQHIAQAGGPAGGQNTSLDSWWPFVPMKPSRDCERRAHRVAGGPGPLPRGAFCCYGSP
jgi:hypothetical protein